MSEYLSKKAVLEWLTEQYFHGMGEEAWNTALSKLQEKIESGAFDADNTEIQRLRAAAIKLHETLNTYWQGDCDKSAVVNAQSNLCDTLSTTTEQTNAAKVKRIECPCCGCEISIKPKTELLKGEETT